MQVVLLERVAKLGQMGETVRVKDGYARNFLLPRGKALRATKNNLEQFETQRVQLEARNLERKSEAEKVGERLDGTSVVLVRQAGDTGMLYGSVSSRDIADALVAAKFTVGRDQVRLYTPIKKLGVHTIAVSLHPEVEVSITANVARSTEEAERQARGESVLQRDEFDIDDLDLEVGAALAEAGPQDY